MGDAEDLAIERIDRVARCRCPSPSGSSMTSEKAVGTTPDGNVPNASGCCGNPMRLRSGMRGTMPAEAYSALLIGWALSVAVARNDASPSAGATCASERAAHAGALEPGRTKSIERNHRRSRITAAANATIRSPPCPFSPVAPSLPGGGRIRGHRGDDEPLRVSGLEVCVESEQRGRLGRHVRLVQPSGVVVDPVTPDLGAGRELVAADGAIRDADAGPSARDDRRRLGHAASPVSSPRHSPPVASRSSSACMKASRSPSSTADVLPVS